METNLEKSSQASQKRRPIYLDNNATTLLDPAVLREMLPFLQEEFGNASSKSHSYGWKAELAVENARKQVADLLQCSTKEIIWTSGATESNNMAILGVVLAQLNKKPHLITSAAEHKAVLDVCLAAQYFGAEVSVLPVNSYGQVEPETLEKAIQSNTRLVSIMAANNEIGTLNNIDDLVKITSNKNILFHCDAAQAAGKVPINLNNTPIDLLSISGHKIYGPKGVGALFIRNKKPAIELKPLIYGGAQEQGLRPGTLNVAGIVGLGKACIMAGELMETEYQRLCSFREEIISRVKAVFPKARLNGHPNERLCNNISFSFPDLSADVFALGLSGLALSSGSACTSGTGSPSHVLKAIGLDDSLARATIRMGLGRFTTEEEVQIAIQKVVSMLEKNKKISMA